MSELIKTLFVSALLEKNEEMAIYWGYKLYDQPEDKEDEDDDPHFNTFYLLNEIWHLFYVEKYDVYFGGHLKKLAFDWEESNRTDDLIIGTIIKNMVCLNIYTSMIKYKKNGNPKSPVPIIEPCPPQENAIKTLDSNELRKIYKKIKKNMHVDETTTTTTIPIPRYVCEILGIKVDDRFTYAPFESWCELKDPHPPKFYILKKKKKQKKIDCKK